MQNVKDRMLAFASLQLQCFSPLSSTASYSQQTRLISVSLTPALSLTDPESVSCQQLNNLVYRAYVYVGTHTFVSETATYQHNEPLQLKLECADCSSAADYVQIVQASAVQFEMKFLEHMLLQSSAISQFLIEDFNKAEVFADIVVLFAQASYFLQFTQQVSCNNFGRPAELTFYYDSQPFFKQSVADICQLSRLSANCGSSCLLQLQRMLYDEFFKGVVLIEVPYQLGSKDYQVESTSGLVKTESYTPTYMLQIEQQVSRLRPELEVDCFVGVSVVFYSNAVMIRKSAGPMTNCPQANGIKVRIVASEMRDYSGKKLTLDFRMTRPTDEYISTEVAREHLEELFEYAKNSSVDISLFYLQDEALLGLAKYQDELELASYDNIRAVVSPDSVCFTHDSKLQASTSRKTIELTFYRAPFLDESAEILRLSGSLLHPPQSGSTCFYGRHADIGAGGVWALLRIDADSFPIDDILVEIDFPFNYYIIAIFAGALLIAGLVCYVLTRAVDAGRFKALV